MFVRSSSEWSGWVFWCAIVCALVAFSSRSGAQSGADVVAFDLHQVASFGTDGSGIFAYAIGTTACNVGDEEIPWSGGTANHPVIAQNLYRYHGGRLQQIGLSWVKHGLTALQGYQCGSCTPSALGVAALGVGCSDPYSATFNGQQNRLGPRSVVDPSTGTFPFPIGIPGYDPVIGRRLQVAAIDLDPALYPGAQYFGEAQYVSAPDALAGNSANNASYCPVSFDDDPDRTLSLAGGTRTGSPAIEAWAEVDPLVETTSVLVPGDGHFFVGHRVESLGGGMWRYDYAVQNLDSHRAARAVEIEVPLATSTTNLHFHDVHHHSGEPMSGDDWTSVRTAFGLRFSTAPFAVDPQANALHWGTLYGYGFESPSAPVDGTLRITLFRPGSPTDVTVTVPVPGPVATIPAHDFVRGDVNQDQQIDLGDVLSLLGFAFQGVPVPDCLDAADIDDGGTIDVADAIALLTHLFAGGPGPAPPSTCGADPSPDAIPCLDSHCP